MRSRARRCRRSWYRSILPTGQGTAIARTDLPTQAYALAFLADGRLVVGGGDGNLYQLDPLTGASTLIGPTGVEAVSGMSQRVFPQR
jgi:hypothetical protein